MEITKGVLIGSRPMDLLVLSGKTLVVMLDAGHGGNTPGKRSPDGMREFEFNQEVAENINKELGAYTNILVHFIHDRSGKTDTPLAARTNVANNLYLKYKDKSKYEVVYLSIHANAFGAGGWNAANGIETYVYESRPAEAMALANDIHKALITSTTMADRGVRAANFHVLRETHMTAILLELGFMTNSGDMAKLRSADYRRHVAQIITIALAKRYALPRKVVVKPVVADEVAPDGKLFKVQVGAFKQRSGAEATVAKLKKLGIDATITVD